jgi:transcriptional regulator GlxA family with amidase domain
MTNTPRFTPNSCRAIDILAFPEVQLLDVAGPLQVFASANDFAAQAGSVAPYRTRLVVPDGGPVVASAGLALAAEPLPATDEALDTLVVAGGQGVFAAAKEPGLIRWLARRAASARRVASVCTGAFLAAEAGLLNGRRATTHWEYCDELARRFPEISVDPNAIFVHDGPVSSSAGVTAGIDLCLALVEQDLGRGIALRVARHLVVFLKRPGGQSQFSAALTLQSADDRFARLHDWIGQHLDEDLSIYRLADRAGMSTRTFLRRYAAATGTTPAKAIERLRSESARLLLSETRLPVKTIARRCGFTSDETLRRSFQRAYAISPDEFRKRFG